MTHDQAYYLLLLLGLSPLIPIGLIAYIWLRKQSDEMEKWSLEQERKHKEVVARKLAWDYQTRPWKEPQ